MATSLTLENLEREHGIPVHVRKAPNAWHLLVATPGMLGSYDMRSVCGRTVGNSRDANVETTLTIPDGKLCKACIRIHRELLNASAAARAKKSAAPVVRDVRDESAPAARAERSARSYVACSGTGKAPISGSRVARNGHEDSVPDDFNGPHKGACSVCGLLIAVNREGVIRRHKENSNRAPEQLITFRIEGEPVTGPSEAERANAVKREIKRRTARKNKGADAREESAPERGELLGQTGLTHAEMRSALDRYYANGGKVPVEVATLPDPTRWQRVSVNWSGTDAGASGAVTPCDFKGDVEIINPERTHGKCPECRAYLPLLDVKSDPDANRIGQHNRYGVPNLPRPKILLSSESLDAVEHGTVPGSPADSDKRRGMESRCDRSGRVVRNSKGGKKKCTGCARTVELVSAMRKKKGELVKVWLYPGHYRPITEELTVDSFRRAGADGKAERRVTPCGTGADAGKGQRDHGSVDGSANTGVQNMPPVQPRGWVGKAGTMVLPVTVRPGVDPEVTGKICPVCEERVDIAHAGKGKSWRRNHAKRLRAYWEARDAERKARREADIAAGRIIPSTERRKARKAASVGSFAEGTVAGRVAHGGERPAVKPVLTPRGMTRAGK